MLLDVIVNTPVQGSGAGQDASSSQDRGGQKRLLLHFAPSAFIDTIVGLASQLIVTTKDALNPKLWSVLAVNRSKTKHARYTPYKSCCPCTYKICGDAFFPFPYIPCMYKFACTVFVS